MSESKYQKIELDKNQTKRLVGIDDESLSQFIEYLLFIDDEEKKQSEKNKVRINRKGGGRKSKLSRNEQILLTLFYLRHHLTFQLLGMMFHVSESTAHNTFNYWQKIMRKALPASLLEQVVKEGENQNDIKEELTKYELLIDTEEQFIERPLVYQKQKKYYSGKKKSCTFKSQVIVLPKAKDIVDVVAGEPGPKSDIKICRETLHKFDENQKFKGDKAYVGEAQITTPKKKPKNGELSESQKLENKEISSERIFVEHLIRAIKIFRVTQERFRLNKSRYQSIFLTICGLVRLRIKSLILTIIKSGDDRGVIDVLLLSYF